MANRGFNSFHGFDTGPAPPGFAPAQPHGVPQYPVYNFPAAAPQVVWPGPFVPPVATPPLLMQAQNPFYPGQWPSIPPSSDHGIPAIHLRNHTGGVGLPPGYNYAFPREHCKMHVFKTATPPWQCPRPLFPHDPATHVKLFVPANTTVKELMQNLGCTNDDPKKNRLYELAELGNGRWAKGLSIVGDDKERVKKEIKALGWDKSRTGHPGERLVVWLWATKD